MYKVLQPMVIGKMELRNRFMRSATQDSTADPTGAVTDRSLNIYEELAAGGVGLIITAHAFVAANGQANSFQYGIHNDEMLPGLRRLVEVAHRNGAKIAVQLSHSGFASSYLGKMGIPALAPSEVGWRYPHREMTDEEIEALIDDYAAAAVRGRDAGFDAVQLHGAHGFMMTQFFSPLTNYREDRWGGSPENRRRLHVEAIQRIRSAVGADYPILMKFGIMDDQEGGADLEEGIAALTAMAEAGLDMVEISGSMGSGSTGFIRAVNDNVTEDTYYRERTAKAKNKTGVMLALVGGIRNLDTAEDIVNSGDADLISMSRPFVREPGLINRWLSGDYRRATCISCNKCSGIIQKAQPVECGEELRLREAQRT